MFSRGISQSARDERDGRARNLSQSGRPRSTAGNKKVITVDCEAHQGSVRASTACIKFKSSRDALARKWRHRAIFIAALAGEGKGRVDLAKGAKGQKRGRSHEETRKVRCARNFCPAGSRTMYDLRRGHHDRSGNNSPYHPLARDA